MAGPGARRGRLGLSSRVRSRSSGAFRALRFACFARQTDLASGMYSQRGEEVEGDRREPNVTEEGKLLAALSSSLIYAALAAMLSRADQVARPHAAHRLHISFVHTRTHRHSAFVYSARLLPPGTQQQRRCKGVRDAARDCVYAGVFAS